MSDLGNSVRAEIKILKQELSDEEFTLDNVFTGYNCRLRDLTFFIVGKLEIIEKQIKELNNGKQPRK